MIYNGDARTEPDTYSGKCLEDMPLWKRMGVFAFGRVRAVDIDAVSTLTSTRTTPAPFDGCNGWITGGSIFHRARVRGIEFYLGSSRLHCSDGIRMVVCSVSCRQATDTR